jgi:hypothetical protein
MLVSHALAYVTASKNGVSEPEIEDFISLDDKVSVSFKNIYRARVRRRPLETIKIPRGFLVEKFIRAKS